MTGTDRTLQYIIFMSQEEEIGKRRNVQASAERREGGSLAYSAPVLAALSPLGAAASEKSKLSNFCHFKQRCGTVTIFYCSGSGSYL